MGFNSKKDYYVHWHPASSEMDPSMVFSLWSQNGNKNPCCVLSAGRAVPQQTHIFPSHKSSLHIFSTTSCKEEKEHWFLLKNLFICWPLLWRIGGLIRWDTSMSEAKLSGQLHECCNTDFTKKGCGTQRMRVRPQALQVTWPSNINKWNEQKEDFSLWRCWYCIYT